MLIDNNIFIDSNELLIITPGTYLEFQAHYRIESKGLIKAVGNIFDSIIFTIADTTFFADSSTTKGGWNGINFLNRVNNDTSIFQYCKFEYGKAVSKSNIYDNKDYENRKGGAIYLNNYSGILVSNCTFYKNLATQEGGGIYSYETSVNIITDNVFTYNKTYYYGGGIKIDFGHIIYIINNFFQYNTAFYINGAYSGGSGAGIYISTAFSPTHPEVYNNKLFNNKSTSIIHESCKYYTIANNIICNNYGAAFFNGHSGSYGKFINNTLCNNYREYFSGLFCISNHLQIKNNVIWNNRSIAYDTIQIYLQGAYPVIEYNCVQYGYEGEGNIDSLPMFVNPTKGAGLDYNGAEADWSLLVDSPCINAGTPDTTGLFLPAYDIAGNPRIFDSRIDMGAYECQEPVFIQSPVISHKTNIVYPNPGTNLIFIKTKTKNSYFELIDFTGKIVMKKHIAEFLTEINVNRLPKGMYFYRIYDNKNVYETGKWVKN
ncbi:MAG: T9SS type A sorting domain-containing protein [Bacteroidales bacterium]|nr:T9SS type A sorting domain-containing protein [Bacteroidales bacterium]